MATLKERIKELCKKNGVSMRKAEKDLGFAQGYLSKIDSIAPRAETIQLLADYFGTPVNELSSLVHKKKNVAINIPKDNPLSRYFTNAVQTESLRIAKEIVDNTIDQILRDDELTLLAYYSELNDDGKEELLKHARLLESSPMYRKGEILSASEKEA